MNDVQATLGTARECARPSMRIALPAGAVMRAPGALPARQLVRNSPSQRTDISGTVNGPPELETLIGRIVRQWRKRVGRTERP
jgi:hypothetical protein